MNAGAIFAAMVESGCTDAQLAAVARAIAKGATDETMPAATSHSRETIDETVSRMVASARADARAPQGDPRLFLAALAKAGISATDQAVGTVIIQHFNRESGRCDPGIKRIKLLAGASRATIFRSLKRLEAAGLLRHARHAGRHNTNQYQPNWPVVARIALGEPVPDTTAGWSHERSQMRPSATQTQSLSKNLSDSLRVRAAGKTKHRPLPGQRELLPPRVIAEGKPSLSSAEVATEEALKRIDKAARRLWPHPNDGGDKAVYRAAIEAGLRVHDAAVAAERIRPGSGIYVIEKALREPQPARREQEQGNERTGYG